MFSPMEHEYFEQLLDSRFDNVKNQHDHINEKLTAILVQTTKTNGRVNELEKELGKLKEWQASSNGHWNGVNKTMGIILTLLGIIVGAIITWQFH